MAPETETYLCCFRASSADYPAQTRQTSQHYSSGNLMKLSYLAVVLSITLGHTHVRSDDLKTEEFR